MTLLRVLRRLLERVVRDPFASAVSCGVCQAWVPGGLFDAHLDWHRTVSVTLGPVEETFVREMKRAGA